ncbi:hypothetical protein MMC06_005147 [Schaereria dolodes]|nr:hypothetical protein [Schaereria dolodes]
MATPFPPHLQSHIVLVPFHVPSPLLLAASRPWKFMAVHGFDACSSAGPIKEGVQIGGITVHMKRPRVELVWEPGGPTRRLLEGLTTGPIRGKVVKTGDRGDVIYVVEGAKRARRRENYYPVDSAIVIEAEMLG